MGTFQYGAGRCACDIDDRVLLHLQIVITTKLRRGEHFLFRCGTLDHPCRTTYWLSPTIPIRFVYATAGRLRVNPEWLDAITGTTETNAGLRAMPEPASTVRRVVPAKRDLVGVSG